MRVKLYMVDEQTRIESFVKECELEELWPPTHPGYLKVRSFIEKIGHYYLVQNKEPKVRLLKQVRT